MVSSVIPREDSAWAIVWPSREWNLIALFSPYTRRERVGKDAMCTSTFERAWSSSARASMVFD